MKSFWFKTCRISSPDMTFPVSFPKALVTSLRRAHGKQATDTTGLCLLPNECAEYFHCPKQLCFEAQGRLLSVPGWKSVILLALQEL